MTTVRFVAKGVVPADAFDVALARPEKRGGTLELRIPGRDLVRVPITGNETEEQFLVKLRKAIEEAKESPKT